MSLSLLLRKSVAFCCFSLLLPAVLSAQTGFVANGAEQAIGGPLPGDQMEPRAAVNSTGGFLVWQDNFADGDGLGIRAVALDNHFVRSQAPFRINQIGAGDQENPQVALLSNGGAVFVWQGGPLGFQRIYARFLSSENTWATGDIVVSSGPKAGQRNPVVAALPNGNVVVIYSSYNQRGENSMHDVYGQILGPDGTKVGAEFAVNQFSSYNQRTPAVAALSGGGFVVAWVSEQQRTAAAINTAPTQYTTSGQPSVDIFARVYNAQGQALAAEFLVNTGQSLCANPSIAAGGNDSFLVAWSQRDVLNPSNSWDIAARNFAGGSVGGTVQGVNTHLHGDQLAPQAAALGSSYLVVWTSLAQDGSREGVFGRYLSSDSSPQGPEFRVNTTILNSQKQPSVASDGASRFLVVWTSYAGGPNSFDLMSQEYATPDYTPVADTVSKYAVPVFVDNNTGGGGTTPEVVSSGPTLDFPAGSASSGGIGFSAAKGSYYGLFYDTNGVGTGTSGYIQATATARKTYTGRVLIGGKSYAFTGKFDDSGVSTVTVKRGTMASLVLRLQLDLAGGDRLRGQVTIGSASSELAADRAVFTVSSKCAYAGTYSFLIPPSEDLTGSPAGYGFGTAKVGPLGGVVWSGTLADGTKLVQNSYISRQGNWPLYATPYTGRGLVMSWMRGDRGTLGGQVLWAKPQGVSAAYAAGFTNVVEAAGSTYTAGNTSKRLVELSSGQGNLIFARGGLNTSFTNSVMLGLNRRMTTLFGSPMSVTVYPASGLFRGTIRSPETGKSLAFQGMLLQEANLGAGFFLNGNSSGQVYLLSPAP